MALGKRRRERQPEAFVVASDLLKSPGHLFSMALNRLPAEHGSDRARFALDLHRCSHVKDLPFQLSFVPIVVFPHYGSPLRRSR